MDLIEKAKLYVAGKVADMPKPEASVDRVGFNKITRERIFYQADIAVQNPYSVSIPICEISYILKSAGRVIASGTIPDPGSLKGQEKTMLFVPVEVPHSLLLSLARDIGRDWDIDYLLELGLIIDLPVIGNFNIPLSQSGEIKLPTFSDLWGSSNEDKE